MAEECTHDCSSCSANCSSRENTIPKEKMNAQSSCKHVIAVMSGKGGVGKSMVT
ncbi:MAG: Mrp/NBP35 family ATP-binding protein, partial [Clostridiales bacterium]|nr:Mrp/NBP35 family ATP-binding protein [Clostridiales bacterium]